MLAVMDWLQQVSSFQEVAPILANGSDTKRGTLRTNKRPSRRLLHKLQPKLQGF